jgi:hypothetical protein
MGLGVVVAHILCGRIVIGVVFSCQVAGGAVFKLGVTRWAVGLAAIGTLGTLLKL